MKLNTDKIGLCVEGRTGAVMVTIPLQTVTLYYRDSRSRIVEWSQPANLIMIDTDLSLHAISIYLPSGKEDEQ